MNGIELENAIAKQKAQEAGLPIGKRVNPHTGKVTVFLLHEQKERDVFAIDAKELIAHGAATLDPIEITDGKTTKKIGARQLVQHETMGFKVVGAPAGEQEQGQDNNENKTVNLSTYSISELKAFGEIAKIENAKDMKKAELIDALTKIGFVPAE